MAGQARGAGDSAPVARRARALRALSPARRRWSAGRRGWLGACAVCTALASQPAESSFAARLPSHADEHTAELVDELLARLGTAIDPHNDVASGPAGLPGPSACVRR